jgi:hypothetical protein
VEHEGGLAGAVGTQQGDPLTLVHVEVDAVERLVPVGIGVGDALQVHHGVAHRWLPRTLAGTFAGTLAGALLGMSLRGRLPS